MTPETFGMDKHTPDLTDDFDFGAFLNFPPDDVDQGGEDGWDEIASVTIDSDLLDPNRLAHSSTAWGFGGSGHASDLVPELCDERRIDLPGPSYISTLLGSYENPEAHLSTNIQPQTDNSSPGSGYGADNLYGNTGASGYLRPAYATVLKTTGPETIAIGDCGEACTIPSNQEPSRSFAPDVTNHGAPEDHCACVSCLESLSMYESGGYRCRYPSCQIQIPLFSGNAFSTFCKHEKSHYGQPGKYTCFEQSCHTVTKNFGDLKRHFKTKHCTSNDKEHFPCPVLWCKYSGNNGFPRKDKLKSHYKNIHEGKPGPAKAGRVIKPATLKPQVSNFGGSAGKQKE